MNFEFDEAMEKLSLAQQVRRYYLKIKRGNPGFAEKMTSEVGAISSGDSEAKRCYKIIRKYMSGIIIYSGSEKYSDE